MAAMGAMMGKMMQNTCNAGGVFRGKFGVAKRELHALPVAHVSGRHRPLAAPAAPGAAAAAGGSGSEQGRRRAGGIQTNWRWCCPLTVPSSSCMVSSGMSVP